MYNGDAHKGVLTSIVCMLHDSHELNGIVSESFDTFEDVLREFLICTNATLGRRNPNVSLIDLRTFWF